MKQTRGAGDTRRTTGVIGKMVCEVASLFTEHAVDPSNICPFNASNGRKGKVGDASRFWRSGLRSTVWNLECRG
jgi:hypothetical protein